MTPSFPSPRSSELLLAGQLGDRRTARAQLLKLAGDEKRVDQANFYLGKLAEDSGNPLQAIDRYARVKAGEHYVDALLRRANLLAQRSEEHTSELQSLMRLPYAVFCLKKTKK